MDRVKKFGYPLLYIASFLMACFLYCMGRFDEATCFLVSALILKTKDPW